MKIFILHQLVKIWKKRRVQYKASKIWNQLPTALKRFYTIKKFNTKSKKFLQSADAVSSYKMLEA